MRKILCMLAIILVAFATTNCKKDTQQQQSPSVATADVSFNITNPLQGGGLKSEVSDTIFCSNLLATYVKIMIDNETQYRILPVFYIGNIPWTTSIKLPLGTHVIHEFLVYNDNNTPNNLADDILLEAAPHANSLFAQYVSSTLDREFIVVLDKKNEIKIDVLCFQPSYFLKFGFVYFYLNEVIIRQQWFFGDFCIKHKAAYDSSDYALQTGWGANPGPYIDVPAIIKVEVYHNGSLVGTFTNDDAAHHYGDKLSVLYADYKQQVDHFMFKLYILVKQGNAFVFVLFKTWNFDDISNIVHGEDGVVDFVLGTCYDPQHPPDYVFPPWLNLPASCNYTIVGGYAPGSLGGYVDAQLALIPWGYDIQNILYASWCADHETTINVGQTYFMDVYSSLYPDLLPAFVQLDAGKWSKINWLFNHLSWWPNVLWYEPQQVIWMYDNPDWDGSADGGVPALLDPAYPTRAGLMKAAAEAYGNNYVPLPGGWATIIFVPHGTPSNAPAPAVQTMIIKIDP